MNRKILMVAAITLILDQISKVCIEMFFHLEQEVIWIENFFSIHYINNYGAAWSILNNRISTIILLSLIALVILYRYMYLFRLNTRNNIAFGLLVGGLVGNLMDRWLFGYVRDFLDFKIMGYDYPIFNIADTAIVIGTVLLIYAIIKGEDQHENVES
ncbi:MAG: signal peptidase II [Bacilli bacterium]|jgi:signal peptidase II|nr:signal peptidase II [Bacilli bacterium]